MLTQDEITKIIEVENFKYEYRKSLEKKDEPKNKILSFLNTSLGIFLLSTILITFGSWIYTEISTSIKEASEKNNRIKILSLEISNRTQMIEQIMQDSISYPLVNELDVLFNADLDYVLARASIPNQSYYTKDEFKNVSMLQLLTELKNLKNDNSFDNTIEAYEKLQDISIRLKNQIMPLLQYRGDSETRISLSANDEYIYKHEILPNLL